LFKDKEGTNTPLGNDSQKLTQGAFKSLMVELRKANTLSYGTVGRQKG